MPNHRSEQPSAEHAGQPAGEQLALIRLSAELDGNSEASADGKATGARRSPKMHDHTPAYLAEDRPVASVILETHLPHLDRTFDYGVPRDLAEHAVPGTRVRVRFGSQQMTGWLVERRHDSEVPRQRLQPVQRVISAGPVLTGDTLSVARLVAARSAGVVSDVLRAAVPPRVAAVEKQYADLLESATTDTQQSSSQEDGLAPFDDTAIAGDMRETAQRLWSLYENGADVWQRIGTDTSGSVTPVRAVLQGLPAHAEHTYLDLVAYAVATVHATGRGAIVVVPDAKTLDRLQASLEAVVPREIVARLHADDKPTPRYRAFMDILCGTRTVALGTRTVAWAPVHNLGLMVVINDGDSALVEQRAPYHHARDVALLRSEHQKVGVLLASQTVTPEAQRLVDTGWATPVWPQRRVLRSSAPRVIATADSWHSEHDSLAGRARLPETAFRTTREALERGPVLVQVARGGYAPTLACERCRSTARCTVCDGPLTVVSKDTLPVCAWCSREALAWSCAVCSHIRWRMSSVGAHRTAEELGRAFPHVPVIASSGDHIRRTVAAEPALVVATPGAEPWTEGGYAAALLLDGDRMLSRPGLRAEEETLRRWFDAAALVRSSTDGGVVVVTSEHERAVNTLVRWDPAGHATRELTERRALHLPPAVRSAALSGPAPAVEHFLDLLGRNSLEPVVRIIGPSPLPGADNNDSTRRALLFFPYAVAADVTQRLRAARAEASALRRFGPVQVRCDIADLL